MAMIVYKNNFFSKFVGNKSKYIENSYESYQRFKNGT